MAKRKLMFLGPPGAGKGTQAQRLADDFGIPQISTGDMLRQARRDGTELGRKAGEFMDAGGLVPDDVVIGIVAERLKGAASGFILDGFPRTVAQAEALAEMGIELDGVVNIQVSQDEVQRRLGGRLSCPTGGCGASYHVEFNAPKAEGICDKCGADLFKREDDQPEAISQRLESYQAKTAPLVSFYDGRGKLLNIKGEGAPSEIEERIRSVVG